MKGEIYMKKILNKRILPSLFISSLFIAGCISTYFVKSNSVYADDSQLKKNYQECEQVTAVINDNINTFVEAYNATVEDNRFLYATSVEFHDIIYLVEDQCYGTYIDFDGDNGYVVSTGNYEIYDMQVSGDLDYLRATDKDIYFSRVDGFLYTDSDGRLLRFKDSSAQNGDDKTQLTELYAPVKSDSTVYPGQYKAGDGRIDPAKIDEYVAARYPEYNYKISVQKLSSSFKCEEQDSFGYYVKTVFSGGSISHYGEGNCALTAGYSILNSWRSNGYVRYLSDYTVDLTTSIKNDILYPTYGTGEIIEEGSLEYNWSTNDRYLDKIPQLYTELRDYAVKTFGYTPESGLSHINTLSTMRHVCIMHNNSISINYTSSLTSVLNYLEERKACLLTFENSSTYGDHAVALLGYRMYERETGWWIFKKYKQIYLYEIADGWINKPKFFDPNTGEAKNLVAGYLV